MPSLYFHDEELPASLEKLEISSSSDGNGLLNGEASSSSAQPIKSAPLSKVQHSWGATPFFRALTNHAEVLKSRLEPRLFLVNPSRSDREVHEIDLGPTDENDRVLPKSPLSTATASSHQGPPERSKTYPPPVTAFPEHMTREGGGGVSPFTAEFPSATFLHPARTQLLSGFSQLTQKAKRFTQDILSQPFAEPIVPHLPATVRSFVNPHSEWDLSAHASQKDSVVGEYESARVFLARWARVVAEEGERSKRAELAAEARHGLVPTSQVNHAKSDLGVFEFVKGSRHGEEQPSTTRTPGNPVTMEQVHEWHLSSQPESMLRKQVFERGLKEGEARRWVWEVLLDVIDWNVGLGLPTAEATLARQAVRDDQATKYQAIKAKWQESHDNGLEKEQEEWHRIDVGRVSRWLAR